MRAFNSFIRFFEFEAHLGLGITFPARSTIINLGQKRGLVISPGPFDDSTRSELMSAFDELFFVAPNAFHHMFLPLTQKHFPKAPIFTPSRVFKKKSQMKDHLAPLEDLQPHLGSQVEIKRMNGNPTLDEYVFWHSESRTLISTDLLFNMKEHATT